VILFYVMIAGIAAARVVGAVGWQALDDWRIATRVGLAVMFIFTGAAHFTGTRADLVRMVLPRQTQDAGLLLPEHSPVVP
jgi:hypothetical protein